MRHRSWTIECGDREIPVTLRVEAERPSRRLGILLPGAGYTCDMPLLYHTRELLRGEETDVICVEENVSRIDAWREASEDGKLAWADATARAVLADVAERHPRYERWTLVGKSLGSYALAGVVEEYAEKVERVLWMTPSLRERWPVMRRAPGRNVAVIGTADVRYELALRHLPDDRIVAVGAGHLLEIENRPARSATVLADVIRRLGEWLGA